MVSKRLLFVAAAALLLALSQALPVAEQAEAASAERTNERQLSHNCPSSFNPVQCTIWAAVTGAAYTARLNVYSKVLCPYLDWCPENMNKCKLNPTPYNCRGTTINTGAERED